MKSLLLVLGIFSLHIVLYAQNSLVKPSGQTILSRIIVPKEFKRIETTDNTFGAYLRILPLKEHYSPVTYYDGRFKPNNNVYVAVVKMDIGTKNLIQCADAVMKLRAEYLFGEKQFYKIHFNLTNGFRMDYSKWQEGYRLKVNGNKTTWVSSASPSSTYTSFLHYLGVIFTYAGTYSLSKELKKIEYANLKPGDVLIKGGFPGHAVIVVDMAINSATGEKIYLLAQSYMPAQEIQILANPGNTELSPWYSLKSTDSIITTPEWVFTINEAMRFAE